MFVAFDATSPSGVGMGQESPLGSHPAGDLQAPASAMLDESPLYVRQDKDTHVVASDRFVSGSGVTHPASPPCPEDEAGFP